MPIDGTVAPAKDGSIGFDTDTPVSRQAARQQRASGFTFCVRYLTRVSDVEDASDLTREEADGILDAGLALSAVQHVARAGWYPSAGLGQTNGGNARANAQEVGLPPGMNLWLDLEGVAGDVDPEDVISYCNAWFSAVKEPGYLPGVYVGADCGLSGDDLYFRLQTQHYWKSGSKVPDVAHRGYQMVQSISPRTGDRNVTKADAFGRVVQWLVRETAAPAFNSGSALDP